MPPGDRPARAVTRAINTASDYQKGSKNCHETTKPGRDGPPAESVDDYLAALPADMRAALERLRGAIRAAAPEAEETISYRIPTYRYHGPLVHFASFPDHASLVVVSRPTLERFMGDLEGWRTSGTTIRFTADHPLPAALVEAIVRARVEENEARAGASDRQPRRAGDEKEPVIAAPVVPAVDDDTRCRRFLRPAGSRWPCGTGSSGRAARRRCRPGRSRSSAIPRTKPRPRRRMEDDNPFYPRTGRIDRARRPIVKAPFEAVASAINSHPRTVLIALAGAILLALIGTSMVSMATGYRDLPGQGHAQGDAARQVLGDVPVRRDAGPDRGRRRPEPRRPRLHRPAPVRDPDRGARHLRRLGRGHGPADERRHAPDLHGRDRRGAGAGAERGARAVPAVADHDHLGGHARPRALGVGPGTRSSTRSRSGSASRTRPPA